MSIQLLVDRLCLLHFPRDQLQRCSHSILKQILFRQYSSSTDFAHPEPIFSYIDNALEVSIFGEYDRIRSDFPQDLCPGLEVSDHVYRALQVDNDDMFDSSKICTIVEPLAKAGVSIFYNSTYQTDLLFVQEEKLPVVHRALQKHGIHISLPDDDLVRLQDEAYHDLAIHSPNDMPSLTPPDTPVTDERHFQEEEGESKDNNDSQSFVKGDRANGQDAESNGEEGREIAQDREYGRSTHSMNLGKLNGVSPLSSAEQNLQQEMACRSVAESLRVERLSIFGGVGGASSLLREGFDSQGLEGVMQGRQQQHLEQSSSETRSTLQENGVSSSLSAIPVLPSPATSLSSYEESGRFFTSTIGTHATSTDTQPSQRHPSQHQCLPLAHAASRPPGNYHQHAPSPIPLQNSRDIPLEQDDTAGNSNVMPPREKSSPTTSPTTTTAFELRHQAIRTLPENLLRCVGLNTELEMGPPRWMLKVIKILFYQDGVQVSRRECQHLHSVDGDNADGEQDDETTTTTTTPRFFSFTATADSVSIITDVQILEQEFEEHELFMSMDHCPLRLIRLDLHRFGLDKVGIVQSVARPLTEAGIELLYLSTFSTANILVLEHRLEDAERILSGAATPSAYAA